MDVRVAGCDLGQTSLKFAILHVSDGGALVLEQVGELPHEGKPLAVFAQWYRDANVGDCVALGATGVHASELREPVVGLPEDACQEATLGWMTQAPPSVNLVSVGGRGYRALSRRAVSDGNQTDRAAVRFVENEKCSSGTGENIQRIAARFGLALDEADSLALGADKSIPITARCSVFTKSEMTHYANEGRSQGELFRGYFDSVARNAFALLTPIRVPGPVWLIGGGARLEALRRSLAELAGDAVTCPPHFLYFEAIGAGLLASDSRSRHGLPVEPGALVRDRVNAFEVLAPPAAFRERVTVLEPSPTALDWRTTPTVLGLDLGSTGAKAALCAVADGTLLLDVYDTTRGNPVAATQRLVRTLLADGRPDIRAVAVTGSGRQSVATVLRAAFPAAPVVVENEIVAHAIAAMRADPEGGADLSIIEIGGQDAKYIRTSGGRIVESDLNKACSAGTGSFLAEQAAFYEINDHATQAKLAAGARRPPDLGQMCTVYVADAATQALEAGFTLGDLLAGLQYSVVHNYLHRVMGQRTLARRVFFQGKPASNPSLGWTLAAVADRDIVVPPHPGAMGAWGIALHARDSLAPATLEAGESIDLEQFLEATVAERTTIVCRDDACQTCCTIDRAVVRVAGREETTLSGGACPKFEQSTRDQPKLAKDAPDPFAARATLLAAFEHPAPEGAETIALPVVGAIAGHVPWLATLVRHLGFGVRLVRSSARSLARGEQLTVSFDSCGPTKVSHAVCDDCAEPGGRAGPLLFPKIFQIHAPGCPPGDSCVTEQAMPEMVAAAFAARGRTMRVVYPVVSFANLPGSEPRRAGARAIAEALGADLGRLDSALERADRAQLEVERELERQGTEALAYAESHDVPAVLVCGSLHVIHDRALNAGIPELLRRHGVVAIPVDGYAISPATPSMSKAYWGDSNRTLRAAASARGSQTLFPLLLSSFGCGPASFIEPVFQALLEGYPHTILENDGHGGAAGFVTRIQAFLHAVRQFRASCLPMAAIEPRVLGYVEPTPHTGPYLDRRVRYVFVSGTDYLGAVFAAVYRAHGYDAVAAPPLSEAAARAGRGDCSGKECLSYQLVWGAFRQQLESSPPTGPVRLVQISGRMCRAGAFPLKDRLSLARLGLDEQVSVTALRIAGGAVMSAQAWIGLVAVDLLRQLYLYHLALEQQPGEMAERYDRHAQAVLALLEEAMGRRGDGVRHLASQWRRLGALLDAAASEFAALESSRALGERSPVVFLSGDLLTKGNDFASGGLCPELARRGVRLVFEPTADFLEFLGEAQPTMLFGRGSKGKTRIGYRLSMVAMRDELVQRVARRHRFLPLPEVHRAIRRTSELLSPRTNGGSALTVGSVLHHWESGAYDGVVLAACWGCDNGLIAESLLRHRESMPALFFYDDGTPLDHRRLDRFVYALRRRQHAAVPAAPPISGFAVARRRVRRLREVLSKAGRSPQWLG